MTLLLTECSEAGLVMAADSAITKIRPNGSIQNIDQQGWQKVLRAPKVKALIGYWGYIGKLYGGRFDEWLRSRIATYSATDLPGLAAELASDMNSRVGNAPLPNDNCVGFHIGGMFPWADGVRRAFFFHVHNGPGYFDISEQTETVGSQTVLTQVTPTWVGGARTLFTVNQDFPSPSYSLAANLATLQRGYITRNGNFLYHAIAWDRLRDAFTYMNLIPGFSLPSDPTKLGPRKGFMIAALETSIRIFKCSNQSKVVGGKVTAEAVGIAGYAP